MKVCLHTTHQITQNYIGGTERFLIKIAKELKLLGWDTFIVCSSTTPVTYVEEVKVLGKIPKEYCKNVVKYHKFNYDFLKREVLDNHVHPYETALKLSSYVSQQLEGIEADLYHFNSFLSASYLDSIRFKNFIITNHENDAEMDFFWGKDFFYSFSQLVKEKILKLQNAKGLYVPSKYYSHFFSNMFSLPVQAIKLGVLLNDFPSDFVKNLSQKEQYFGNNDGFVILLPSRLNVLQKGHDIALKACQILKNTEMKFRLIITGLGKSSEEEIILFRKRIKDYNVEDIVILSSYGDILNAYKMCDVVISPERYCSYGLSISESLSLGIDTVLSDIPTYREIASSYKHAHFFENGNPQALSEQLLLLWNKHESDNRQDMIRFRINNDIRDCAKLYSNIYDKILINEN